jgi:hypothetical protein
MYHASRATRVLSTLGAGTLGLLVLAGPTPAVGDDTHAVNLRYANVVAQTSDPQRYPDDWRPQLKETDAGPQGSADDRRWQLNQTDAGPQGSADDRRWQLNQIDTPPTTTEPGHGADRGPVANEGSLEYLQIALGGLAGAIVAAAAAGALGLRRRHHLAPSA